MVALCSVVSCIKNGLNSARLSIKVNIIQCLDRSQHITLVQAHQGNSHIPAEHIMIYNVVLAPTFDPITAG
jgi:hypothetical protein